MKITAQMVKELRDKTDAAMMACKKALQETNGDLEAAIEHLRKAGIAKAEKRAGKTAAEGQVAIIVSDNHQSAFMVEMNSETDFVARDQNFKDYLEQILVAGLANKAEDVQSVLAAESNGVSLETVRQQLVNKIGENVQLRRVAYMETKGCVGQYIHGDRIGVLVELDSDNMEAAKDVAMHVAATNPDALNPEDVSPELIAKEKEIFTAQAKESGKPQEIIDKMITGRINKFLKEVSLTSQPFVKDPSISVADLLKKHNTKIVRFVRFEVGEGIEKETQNFADEVMAQAKGTE